MVKYIVNDIAIQKDMLRKKLLNVLRSQKEEERLSKSVRIREKLFALPEFQQAQTVLFYASFDGEVETFDMMKHTLDVGKKIALPRIVRETHALIPLFIENLDHDLVTGPYGISEPGASCDARAAAIDTIDLAVVPGVAFDAKNNRLGRGGGYYDRFLKQLPTDTSTVGLAFDFQIVDAVPVSDTTDLPVSRVVTN